MSELLLLFGNYFKFNRTIILTNRYYIKHEYIKKCFWSLVVTFTLLKLTHTRTSYKTSIKVSYYAFQLEEKNKQLTICR